MSAVRLLGSSTSLNAAVPAAIMAVVLMMVLPVPPLMLDLLISCNITLSVVTVIATMYIERPVELSVYPSLLLLLTLLRLALNISSTRLILMNGQAGSSAAGEVIEAFGDFVVGGNFVVGIVIFILLIAIQYVVINHGAVRISEVTARFTLDAMPGKQMAIDADLNAGLIDESEAKRRREAVSREAEFYGAMDGAVRFTQRDAIASIIITGVNILAGFLIGALSHGMELEAALETYTVLTVGEALLISVSAVLSPSCSPGVIAVAALVVVSIAIAVRWSSRRIGELRERAAFEEALRQALEGRLTETVSHLDSRLRRMETAAVSGRAHHRREASEAVRDGADALAVAQRFRLSAAELELLTACDELRRDAA